MYGNLGTVKPLSNIETTLYHFISPNMETSTCNLNIVNTGTSSADVIVAITNGGQISLDDYYVYNTTLEPSGILERTGIVMSNGEKIIVLSTNNDCVFRVHGFEENISELSNPDNNIPPSLNNLQTDLPVDVTSNNTYTVTFWGATDPNGDNVFGRIDNISPANSLSFSKTNDIKIELLKSNSDILQMFVYNPSIINVIRFRLVLTDKKGGSSYRYYTMNLTGVGNWRFYKIL